jgi:adenylosuccinate synthase
MNEAYLVAGLFYGDEGKGATVDYLVRETGANLVIRYNGGAQAGHSVVAPEGRHHIFSQFGSGTFSPGVRTFLSRYMMVNPLSMMTEEAQLRAVGVDDAFSRTMVDARALIITPFQKAVNKIQQNLYKAHNSCGMGIGQTRADHIAHKDKVLFAGDLRHHDVLRRKLNFMQEISLQKVLHLDLDETQGAADVLLGGKSSVDWLMAEYVKWPAKLVETEEEAFHEAGSVVFEGAQGVLLDEVHGEVGFNTWTDCTFHNAFVLLNRSGWKGLFHKIGVLRTYLTRHGDGPLPTEQSWMPATYPERHNASDGPQGKFRKGLFSEELLDRSLKICGGVHGFALNHMDENASHDVVSALEKRAPIWILGKGPKATDRASWGGKRFKEDSWSQQSVDC